MRTDDLNTETTTTETGPPRRKTATRKTARRATKGKKVRGGKARRSLKARSASGTKRAAGRGNGESRGRTRLFSDDAKINVTWKGKNGETAPRSKGEGKQFELAAKCKTIGEYRRRGGNMVSLYYNWRQNWLTLDGKRRDRENSR